MVVGSNFSDALSERARSKKESEKALKKSVLLNVGRVGSLEEYDGIESSIKVSGEDGVMMVKNAYVPK